MFRTRTLIVLAVIAAMLTACGAVHAQLQNFWLQGQTNGWSRISDSMALGFEFTPVTNLTVVAVGRMKGNTFTQNHLINIWTVSDKTLVGGATVTPASLVDGLGFAYVPLSSPVTLLANQAYRIAVDEYAGGDTWLDGNYTAALLTDSTMATLGYPVQSGGSGGAGTSVGKYPGVLMNWVPQGWRFGSPTFYTGTLPAVAPAFTPQPGAYAGNCTVTIATTTSGASIRYTTDGTDPSDIVGTLYSGPVSISHTLTLKAIAYMSGIPSSPVTSGVYTISGGAVAGTVTDGINPLAGVLVKDIASGTSTTTAADGTYSLVLAAGAKTIEASLPGYSTETLAANVTDGTTTSGKNFTLTASYVSGVITDLKSGLPIAGATVRIPNSPYTTQTATDGSYSLRVTAPATYSIVAEAVSHASGTLNSVAVAKGQTLTGQNLSLAPGWDFAAEFSVVNAPNAVSGPWSYRYDDGTAVAKFTYPEAPEYANLHGEYNGNGIVWWTQVAGDYSGTARLVKNILSTALGTTTYRAPGKVIGRTGTVDQKTIVRFTAPAAGRYTISARWAGVTAPSTQCKVAMLYNDAYLFGDPNSDPQLLDGFAGTAANGYTDTQGINPVIAHSEDLDLGLGETVDCVIMESGDTYAQIDMTVTPSANAGYIVGRVTAGNLPGNPPVPNATVNVTPGGFSTVTDSTGTYFIPVEAGDYSVEATASNFNTIICNVTVVGGSQTRRDFSLTHGDTWNLINDFTTLANPNLQWSYGTLNGNVMTPYPVATPFTTAGIAPGVDVWRNNTSDQQDDKHRGWFGKVSGTETTFGGGGMPGATPAVRWTAPDTRIVKVDMTISADAVIDSLPVSLKKNGNLMVTKTVASSALTASYETQLVVNQGDAIDLALCNSSNTQWGLGLQNEHVSAAMIVSPGTGQICSSLTALKARNVGDTVFLTTPTAVICASDRFQDPAFYIESGDRSQGMKCIGNADLPLMAQGSKVTFSGTIANDPNGSGQKVVVIQSINSIDSGTTPAPIGVGSKAYPATGMKPLNMLVRVWGKLTSKVANPDSATNTHWPYLYWIINDGGQDVKVPLIGQTSYMDISYISTAVEGDYISVLGIATLDGTGKLIVLPWHEDNINDYAGM